jgi:predicted DNA binding CopG/RHH family protein
MKKKLPTLTSDEQAEEFVAIADLAKYDLSTMASMRFELKREDKSINPARNRHPSSDRTTTDRRSGRSRRQGPSPAARQ